MDKGRNADMASRSPVLSGYEEFIAEIKANLNSMNLAEAIKAAIKTYLSKNILVSFLKEQVRITKLPNEQIMALG